MANRSYGMTSCMISATLLSSWSRSNVSEVAWLTSRRKSRSSARSRNRISVFPDGITIGLAYQLTATKELAWNLDEYGGTRKRLQPGSISRLIRITCGGMVSGAYRLSLPGLHLSICHDPQTAIAPLHVI